MYTQRFYMFHSYHRFHRNSVALAALFLAAKVEEQPRKLEHVIKMAHICLLGRDAPPLDTRYSDDTITGRSNYKTFHAAVQIQ